MGHHSTPKQERSGTQPARDGSRFAGRRAKIAAIGSVATAAAVGAGFVMATGANAATPTVSFAQTSAWNGGYVGQYTINNTTGTALSNWTLTFTLPSGESVTTLWNGTEKAGGQTYTVTSAGWNNTIAPGASANVGFEVNGNGQPAACTFDGSSCSGGASTAPPVTASISAAPSTQPSKSGTPSTAPSTGAPSTPASPSSAPTSSAPTSPPSSGSFGGFAPYVDMTLYPEFNLVNGASTEGTKYFNLAFLTNGGGTCNPEWGGVTPITDPATENDIAALQAEGGNVRVSFGGESGTEIAADCSSASQLAAAYQSVVSEYNLKYIDFDIEGAAIANTSANDLRNQALAQLEKQDPGLQVSYTLPVLPTGLTSQGVAVLQSAESAGVSVAAVNVMAMDYGSSFPGDMAQLAEQAATATAGQVRTVWTSLSASQAMAKIAVTPMIGVNDAGTSETFSLSDASTLASWAKSNGLAWTSFWSATRDSQCSGGALTYAQATCSSIDQSAGAFGQAFSSVYY
jgi:hypothetical protein